MRVEPVTTAPVRAGDSLTAILDAAIPALAERSVVAVSSKIVALCEGAVVALEGADKQTLVRQQADLHLPPHTEYHVALTIKHNMLIANAGIDESNGDGHYVLWPQDPQGSANAIRTHLWTRHGLKSLGVVIVDSHTTPLRWGSTGIALSHSGFAAIRDYVASPDIFGRPFAYERANIADGLAAAAVVVMGEGAELTPIALLSEIPFVEFQPRDPSTVELERLAIPIADDLYRDILSLPPWQRGDAV